MIELYYWPTPNGHKITMFLEEADLEYSIYPVDISTGDQFKPEFLAISPNNRMPAIIDLKPNDGGKPIPVFESGAILVYLAEKTRALLPSDLRDRKTVLEWVFWQVGGLGPMAGQNHHFVQYAPEKIRYAIERYVKETNRLYGVLDRRLAGREFIGQHLHDCGHRRLSVDCPVETPAAGPRLVPESPALVQCSAQASRHAARLCQGRAIRQSSRGYRRGKEDSFRSDSAVGANEHVGRWH
jgi:glutathione S-transferase